MCTYPADPPDEGEYMTQGIIALIGTLVAAGIGAWAALRARRPRRAKLDIVDAFSTKHADSPSAPTDPDTPTHAATVGLEIVDVDIPSGPMANQHPVMDVKLQNRGGQSIVLKRLGIEIVWARRFEVPDRLTVYRDISGGVFMPPSATYEVQLPDPAETGDHQVTLGVSHVIAPGDADRLLIRLVTDFPHSRTRPYLAAEATFVYLLRLKLQFGARDRTVSSRTIAVACPGNVIFIPTVDGLRKMMKQFLAKVDETRRKIELQMSNNNQEPPDWAHPDPQDRDSVPSEYRMLTDDFWNPRDAIKLHLLAVGDFCSQFLASVTPDMPDGLGAMRPKVAAVLEQMPALRAEFGA